MAGIHDDERLGFGELGDLRTYACAMYAWLLIIDVNSDPSGSFWALITLFPVLALAVYLTVIVQRRDTVYLNALIGQIICEYINGKLKQYIRQPRPTSMSCMLIQLFWARAMVCLLLIPSFVDSFVHFGRCISYCTGPNRHCALREVSGGRA